MKNLRLLSGNTLKILAAVLMVIDHIGVAILPEVEVLRDIGRVSMPLFAFMIAEGCRYTKNKPLHFSLLFILGVLCQIVYYYFDGGSLYMSILITFSLSVVLIYSLQYAKKSVFSKDTKIIEKITSVLLFAVLVFLVRCLTEISYVKGHDFYIDYGFWGIMLPVFASIFDFRNVDIPEKWKWIDNYYLKLIPFTVGIILLCLEPSGVNEWYALVSLVPLALYSGEKGKLNLKYFFYIFYPVHLVIIEGIVMFAL